MPKKARKSSQEGNKIQPEGTNALNFVHEHSEFLGLWDALKLGRALDEGPERKGCEDVLEQWLKTNQRWKAFRDACTELRNLGVCTDAWAWRSALDEAAKEFKCNAGRSMRRRLTLKGQLQNRLIARGNNQSVGNPLTFALFLFLAKEEAGELEHIPEKGETGTFVDQPLENEHDNLSHNPHYRSNAPLFIAAAEGRTDLVKVLLVAGADPNKKNVTSVGKVTALFMAAWTCERSKLFSGSNNGQAQVALVKTLIDKGAEVNVSPHAHQVQIRSMPDSNLSLAHQISTQI